MIGNTIWLNICICTRNKPLRILYKEKKNDFAQVSISKFRSENLDLINLDLKLILLDYRNNYIRNLSIMSNAAKSFHISNKFERPT